TATDGVCHGTQTVAVLTYSNPVISIVPSASAICAGASVTMAIAGADLYSMTNNPPGSPPLTFTLSVLQLTATTNYIVTGTNAATGCSASAQQVILVKPLPDFSIVPSSTVVCSGHTATLSASSTVT